MAIRPTDEQFADFTLATWPGLYRTAYLLLGDHAEAEDLVQTALAKTYAGWHRLREIEAAPAYAKQTMLNTAATWFRRRSWRNERPTQTLPEQSTETDHTVRSAMLAALDTLPPRQRAVVVLRYYEDLDVRHTAHILGCTEGTVKSQTSAGLDKLRNLLGDTFHLGATHD